jgi:hypothetical protein
MSGKRKQRPTQTSILKALLSSPLMVVITVATIVVFLISLISYVRRGGFWAPEVDAHVYNQNTRARKVRETASGDQRIFAFQGEVHQRVERLRESSALVLALSLEGVQASEERRAYQSVEALVRAVSDNGGIPPGMVVEQGGGVVSSPNGVYYVRYRVDPLGVEVLSVGKGNMPGPPMLIRLPDDELAQNVLTYYVAPTVEGAQAPRPFASAADVINGGWRPEPFKAANVSPEEAANQRAWISSEVQGN